MLWRYRLASGNGQTSQMSEEQFALPTFLPKTAIVGIRNIYDFPNALLELQDTFKRSLNFSV